MARRNIGLRSASPLALHHVVVASVSVASLFVLLGACGGSRSDVCDPSTIEVNGSCHWTKNEACDAAGCLPPAECVLIEDKPARVECHKAE